MEKKALIVDEHGKPIKSEQYDLCPNCKRDASHRVPSCGFGISHLICQCGFEFNGELKCQSVIP